MILWCAAALATPPAAEKPKAGDGKATVVIEVVPTIVEGQVKIFMTGHEGDQLFVDGWEAGTLPLETTLAEGPHRFKVKSPSSEQEIEGYIVPVVGKIIELDLLNPPKPPAETPAP